MCQRIRPIHLCRCHHTPTWEYCPSANSSAHRPRDRPCASPESAQYLARPGLVAYEESLEFCCSEECCAEFVRVRRERYAALVAEQEELVRSGEAVGMGAMANLAEKLKEAKEAMEAVELRHGICGRLRASYEEDLTGEEGGRAGMHTAHQPFPETAPQNDRTPRQASATMASGNPYASPHLHLLLHGRNSTFPIPPVGTAHVISCEAVGPKYLCACGHRPAWVLCDRGTFYVERSSRGVDREALDQGLGFCCSEACCAGVVQVRKDRYDALVAENEELVRKGEAIGPAEMARQAGKLREAREGVEGVELKHKLCGGLRQSCEDGLERKR